ncbi:MAG: MBL fold metallo-hydrolase [Deltaproteobacteria bacterium]|nr:MAG: MBL fold metallo-hydrolase [Deltaproteobacteria bacterium]
MIGDRELVVIDPGSPWPEEQAKLDTMLDHFANEGRFVREILLTHFHADHVGGANHLRRRLGVPVAAHPLTIERLEGEVTVDRELPDLQSNVIDLGRDPVTGQAWRLRAIHTPGHAKGHLVFVDERFGTLLAGDMLAGVGTVVIDPPEGNMAEYLESLRRLQQLSLDLIFPAHGPMLADPRRRLQEYLDHRQMREDRIVARLSEGPAAMEDLLRAVYTDISKRLFPLAERSLTAHLEKLLEEGRISKENHLFALRPDPTGTSPTASRKRTDRGNSSLEDGR